MEIEFLFQFHPNALLVSILTLNQNLSRALLTSILWPSKVLWIFQPLLYSPLVKWPNFFSLFLNYLKRSQFLLSTLTSFPPFPSDYVASVFNKVVFSKQLYYFIIAFYYLFLSFFLLLLYLLVFPLPIKAACIFTFATSSVPPQFLTNHPFSESLQPFASSHFATEQVSADFMFLNNFVLTFFPEELCGSGGLHSERLYLPVPIFPSLGLVLSTCCLGSLFNFCSSLWKITAVEAEGTWCLLTEVLSDV